MEEALRETCLKAMIEGKKLDLSGCVYGKPHWGGTNYDLQEKYYFFLAGFVKTIRARMIFEIGTHWGGSIMAMARGLSGNDTKDTNFVTVDITYENQEGLKPYPYIKRIQGNSLDKLTVKKVVSSFNEPIDLMYIDASHNGETELEDIRIYVKHLKPKYLILDDIHLNPSMEKLWNYLAANFKERTFDASEIAERKCGFGVIELNYPLRLRGIYYYKTRLKNILLKIPRKIKNLSSNSLFCG